MSSSRNSASRAGGQSGVGPVPTVANRADVAGIEDVLLEQRPGLDAGVRGHHFPRSPVRWCRRKLEIPIAHVEAGLRSFNRSMPEEHKPCSWTTVPTLSARRRPGGVPSGHRKASRGVHLVGDTMFDAVPIWRARRATFVLLTGLSLDNQDFVLADRPSAPQHR